MGKSRFDVFDTLDRERNTNQIELINSVFYKQLYNIATNLFTWENLPRDIRSTWLETMLISNGCACMVEDNTLGIIVAPCNVSGRINIDGNPKEITLGTFSNDFFSNYSSDFTHGKYSLSEKDKFVVCYNDNTITSLLPTIELFATSMTNTFFSMLTNISQQKFPTIVVGDENSKLSFEIIKSKVDGGEPFILLRDKGSLDMVNGTKVFNTNVPFVADKLKDSLDNLFNMFLASIGVNNLPNTKKERMLVDEVNVNNESLNITRDAMLENRLYFAEKCNEIFGTNISVTRNPISKEAFSFESEV